MRILGVVPSTTAVYIATLAFVEDEAEVVHVQRIAIPNDDDQSRILLALFRFLTTVMGEQACERVAIICAGDPKSEGPRR